MAPSHTNTKRKRSGQKPMNRWVKRFLILVPTVFMVSAIISVTNAVLEDSKEGAPVAVSPYGTLERLVRPEVFESAYLRAVCDPDFLEQAQTMRIRGTVESDGGTRPFGLFKRRPDQMLYTLDFENYEVAFGVSGDRVWRRVRAADREDAYTLLEGEEAASFKAQTPFFNRLISAIRGEGTIRSIEAESWQGKDCLVVELIDIDQQRVRTIIDPVTLFPIVEQVYFDAETVSETTFSDYRDIGGMRVPHRMVTSVEGGGDSTVQLESVSLNSGVPTWIFDVPDSVEAL